MNHPAVQQAQTHEAEWPGWDDTVLSSIAALRQSGQTARIAADLESRLKFSNGSGLKVGPVPAVNAAHSYKIVTLVTNYLSAVQAVVDQWPSDPQLQSIIAMDACMVDDANSANKFGDAIDLARIDLLTCADGELKVLETNANCPGCITSVVIAAEWRGQLGLDSEAFPSLPFESERWFGSWFKDLAFRRTGEFPSSVALLCPAGANDFELDLMADSLALEGVEAFRADPREISMTRTGAMVKGRRVSAAYLKMGMRDYVRLHDDLTDFVSAVRECELYVQNGQRGRLVGDNKLVLAALSDPRTRAHIDNVPADVDEWLPWSRRIDTLATRDLDAIEDDREAYVLKRPHSTRGQGVVLGSDLDPERWRSAVAHAVRERWLVQGRVHGAVLPADLALNGEPGRYHDFAVSMTSAGISGAYVRSSENPVINVAQGGALHAAFLGR